nr:reverse transcriptase domain-containing protein [Tanacetum cinerariifolium]
MVDLCYLISLAYVSWYQEPIKTPLRRNRNINDVYEQEFEQRIMARTKKRLDQFVDQLADRMNDTMNPMRREDRNGRRSKVEELENPFFEGGNSSSDNPLLTKENESEPIILDIKDEDEEKKNLLFGDDEDNIEDVVVVANDIFSSMIKTTLSVDFSKTIDSNPRELIWLQKGNLVEVSIFIGKKYQEGYLKAKTMDDKLGFRTIKVRGRVIIKKGNLMHGIQIWML